MTDDVNDFLDYVQGRQDQAVRRAIPTDETDPDKAARAQVIADHTGIDPALVRGNLDTVEQQYRTHLTTQLLRNNPKLQDYVNSHPLAAETSADDWGQLDVVSQHVQKLQQDSAFVTGLRGFREALHKPIEATVNSLAAGFGSERLGSWIPQKDYEEMIQTPQGRINYALAALIGSPLEIPMRGFTAVTHAAGEATEHVHKMFGASDDAAKKGGNEVELMIQLGLMHMGSTGVHVPPELNAVASRVVETARRVKPYVDAGVDPPVGLDPLLDQIKAQETEHELEALKEAIREAQKSNTRERNPELFADFVRQHTDADIGISSEAVRKLYADKIPMPDDGLLGWVPGIEDQLYNGDMHGGDIKVPLADWLAKVEPDVAKELHDHIRVRANGLTLDEAKNLKPIDMDEDLLEPAFQRPEDADVAALKRQLNEGVTPKVAEESQRAIDGQRDAAGLKPIGQGVKLKKISQGEGRFADVHDFDLMDEEGKRVGDIQLTYDPKKKDLFVEYVRHDEGPQAFGPRAMRDVARQLKQAFPEAKTISGIRVSGAREEAARTGTGTVPGEWAGERVSMPLKQAGELVGGLAEERQGGVTDTGANWVDLGKGLRVELADKFTEKEAEVYAAVDKVAKKLAPRLVDIAPVRRIEGGATGVFQSRTSRIPFILWAFESGDAVGSVRHEIIHHLRRTGFFTPEEWSTLRDAAVSENWISKYNIAKRYKGAGLGTMIEEAVAEHFAHWNREEYQRGNLPFKGPNTGLALILQKMAKLYYAIREAVKSTLGFEPDWKDLFQKVEKGEVGARKGVQPLEREAFRGPTYQVEGREVLYHGTSKDTPFRGFRSSRRGTWLTTNPEEASQYAIENESMGAKYNPQTGKFEKVNIASRVIPAHHTFEKTKVVTELPKELQIENYKKAQAEYFDKLRADGYDSFRIKGEKGHDVVVALDNSKLHPAYAGGEFGRAMQMPEQGELDVTRIEDKDLFAKANAVGMTIKQYKGYLEKMAKQDEEDSAFAKVQNQKAIERRQTEEWKANEKKLREEIGPDIRNRPDLAADEFLREGVLYGDKIKGRPRLDSNKLTAEQKEGLPRDYYTPGGIDPDDAAGLFGYHSGTELVDRISRLSQDRGNLGPRQYVNKLVDAEVERRMRVEHGDLAQNIIDEAQEHVISQTQFDMLHEETLALATKAGMEMSLTKEDMKLMAKQGFDAMPTKGLRTEEFLRQALRANELAERALLEGDATEAFRQKQKQTFAFLFAREAKRFEKDQKRFNRLTAKYSKRDVSGVEPEYTNYIHAIMQRFGIPVNRTSMDLARELEAGGHGTLQEFIDRKNGDFGNMAVDDRLLDPSFKKPVGQLNVEEFRAVNDALTVLNKAGMDERKVIRAGEKEDKAKVVDGMTTQLETFPLKEYALKPDTTMRKLGQTAKQYMTVGILNAETWLNRWDRDNLHGFFNQWLVRPLSTAANRKQTLGRQFSKMLGDLGRIEDAGKQVRSPFVDPLSITRTDDVGRPYTNFTRENVAAMISNAGNDYNWDVLTKGHNADPQITKQWLIQNSTKADWVRAEKLGKIFNEAFEMAQTVYRNIYGVAPPKIELTPVDITFPNGERFTSEGWYHPIIKDEKRTNFVRQARGEDVMDRDKGLFPSIANGYTKRRTGKVDVLALDYKMVEHRLEQVLHDVAFRAEVIEAAKIVKDKDLRKAVRQYYGDNYVTMLDNWLSDVAGASNIQSGIISNVTWLSNMARTNVIGSLIGFNPGTVLKHGPTALVNSMYEVGLRRFTSAFKDVSLPHLRNAISQLFLGDEATAERTNRFIEEHSEEIQRRAANWEETIGGQAKIVAGRSTLRDQIIKLGSKPVAYSDMLSAKPTWLAAYLEEMEKTGDHGNAVFAGDRAVRRAHGSTAITNQPELVRRAGPFGSWLTTLYGFFSTQMQRRAELAFKLNDTYKLGRDGEMKAAIKNLGPITALAFSAVIWPTIIEEMVTSIGTDDHRSGLTRALYGALGGMASSFLYFRDLAHGVTTGQEPSVGMATTPAHDFGSMFRDIKLGTKAFDKAHAGKTVQDFINVFGDMTGMAPHQVGKVLRFGINVARDRERIRGPSDVGVGLMRGTAKRRVEK